MIMKRKLTLSESIDFNIYIDKLGITNREIYRAILEDYLDGCIKIWVMNGFPLLHFYQSCLLCQ